MEEKESIYWRTVISLCRKTIKLKQLRSHVPAISFTLFTKSIFIRIFVTAVFVVAKYIINESPSQGDRLNKLPCIHNDVCSCQSEGSPDQLPSGENKLDSLHSQDRGKTHTHFHKAMETLVSPCFWEGDRKLNVKFRDSSPTVYPL